ncbi:SGNH/GDSL hydrolase family protein [uncultured Roseobacter sp.]|uniref:SGNH/GDSL hydrolase family protein n=1 Tax=uncultured Roseobacter sp. TaxID=114847 RepID=UPI002610B571|nr:SGNH/GDSL hydrolase family protein [uncultured Roseobacter sp.]
MKKRIALATAFALGLSGGAQAASLAEAFSSFWVFGDSLSDDGNLPPAFQPPAPYNDGRFTDGLVWNEDIQQEFRDAFKPTENFALGGARTSGDNPSGPIPGLDEQAAGFAGFAAATGVLAGTRDLASIWAGANNIFQAITAGADAVSVATAAANDVASSVRALAAAGIEEFLVFNIPDLSNTPAYAGTAAEALAGGSSLAFNRTLRDNLDGLASLGFSIRITDAFGAFNDIRADPAASGLSNVTDACIGLLASGGCDPSQFLFWDDVHPTGTTHQLIEAEARAALLGDPLPPVPLPAGFPLLAAGLGVLGFAARRKRAA